ncbi:MAG: serine--tRNA ligase [Pseudomonadota bacterium]
MFDLKWICDNPEALDAGLARRGAPPLSASIIEKDEKRRHVQTELQQLQNERNTVAKAIGQAKQKGEDAAPFMEKAQQIKKQIPALEEQSRQIENELKLIVAGLPNIPKDDVPSGKDESDNVLVREVGIPKDFEFTPKRHYEIGEQLELMDFETASRISGSRFVILKGALARLERALAAFMLDLHTQKFGYQEIMPPTLVRESTMFGTGQLPKMAEEAFKTTDDRWLIPTSEVPLANLVRETILEQTQLPLRYTAYSQCFRSEAGAAGKDTRGMLRQHQFSKVELVSITTPEQSSDEHERMLGAAEEVLKQLRIPYRVMMLSTGDLGATAQKTYDIEVWLPGEQAYREISSCSICGDYQARRMNARYRPLEPGGKPKPEFAHTLNGTGIAIGRTIVAILENYQQEDQTVTIPDILIPYMNGLTTIAPETKS